MRWSYAAIKLTGKEEQGAVEREDKKSNCSTDRIIGEVEVRKVKHTFLSKQSSH